MFLIYRMNCNLRLERPGQLPKNGQINSAFSSKLQKFSFLSPAFVASAYFWLLHKFKIPMVPTLPPFFLLFQLPLFHQLRPVSHTHSIPSSLLLARLSRPSVTSPYYPSVSSLLSTIPPPLLDPLSLSKKMCSMSPPPSLFPVLIFQSEDEIRDDYFSLAHCSKIIDHGWTFLHQK